MTLSILSSIEQSGKKLCELSVLGGEKYGLTVQTSLSPDELAKSAKREPNFRVRQRLSVAGRIH